MYLINPTYPGIGKVATGEQPHAVLDKFGLGSSTLTNRHYHQISKIARFVVAQQNSPHPIRWIHLVGHTDQVGGHKKNCRLSLMRTRGVMMQLMKEIGMRTGGDIPDKLGVIREARGSTQLVEGASELSRRVEVFLYRTEQVPRVLHKCPQPGYCLCDR